ncbi:OTU-like cysteine protease family protein [Prunus dulcis]|uniref:OTU-like cysteine protease family protein n=1 Tax=Prunus dulcis TaxID=3755 RepID=A0A4Y1R6K6_PRUDU|nr:OTU-like cysteine protease family protein [Prunus dulcis]
MKFFHMWKKIHAEFCEKIPGSTRTEMALSSRWKILNKELGKWRDALAKAMDNYRSTENRTNEHKCGSVQPGVAKKSFNHHECWEVVKYCKRFIIIPTGLAVVLNEMPLRDSMTSDSPLDSPMSQDPPIEKEPSPLAERPRRQRKREIARQNGIRIEMEQKRQDNELAFKLSMHEKGSICAKKIWTRQIGKPWRWIQVICPLKQNNFGS